MHHRIVRNAALASVAVALSANAAQAAAFDGADLAFAAGVKGCLTRFDGIKTRQPFDDPSAFPGFAPSPDSATAPGVRSLMVGVTNAQILKADLDGPAAVYVVIPRGGLPVCRTIATDAPGAHDLAHQWLDAPQNGWVTKVPEEVSDDPVTTRSQVYGRPFQGDISVGATLMWPTSHERGSLTALSTMTLARDR